MWKHLMSISDIETLRITESLNYFKEDDNIPSPRNE